MEQCRILEEILKTTAIGDGIACLDSIGGPKNAGKMSISKKLGPKSSVVLINQSVTGIYENKIDLMTI